MKHKKYRNIKGELYIEIWSGPYEQKFAKQADFEKKGIACYSENSLKTGSIIFGRSRDLGPVVVRGVDVDYQNVLEGA